MERLMRILSTAIAIAAGVLVLAGYLIPYPPLPALRDFMIFCAVVVAAFAFILGFFNVLRVHLRRITRARQDAFYSSMLIIAALVSLVLTLLGHIAPLFDTTTVADTIVALSDGWFQYVISPLQASVAGLIAFTLLIAAFRLLRNRKTPSTILAALVFLSAALIVLLGTLQLPGVLGQTLVQIRTWAMNIPVMAGMRGLLIGVGLGTLLVGLRVIAGLDRPYSG